MSSSDDRAFYKALASTTRQALEALRPTASGRKRGLRSRKLQTLLRHRKTILDQLHQGELNPEQALVLLMENEGVQEPSAAVSDYLTKVSGTLKGLELNLPEGGPSDG